MSGSPAPDTAATCLEKVANARLSLVLDAKTYPLADEDISHLNLDNLFSRNGTPARFKVNKFGTVVSQELDTQSGCWKSTRPEDGLATFTPRGPGNTRGRFVFIDRSRPTVMVSEEVDGSSFCEATEMVRAAFDESRWGGA
jgi:hypothetical protein